MIVKHWPSYDINFPARARTLATGYNSLSSDRLDAVVRELLPSEAVRPGARIEHVAPDHVRLAGGETLSGAVIDARGPAPSPGLHLGWQKFLGRSLQFDRPHGLERPVVMDATVEQADGYRFVYCLPFDHRRMLVEDTYYSLSPALEPDVLRERISDYCVARCWGEAETLDEEQGILPVALGGSIQELWNCTPGVPRIGLKAGFFHPVTGYSLPDAVRIAMLIARQADLSAPAVHRTLLAEAKRLWRQRKFYRLLNRMLFHAAAPQDRYKVLEHFYRLEPDVIARFYAARSTSWDKLRILSGKPPVPIGGALAAMFGQASSKSF
jgi:lycopene beta-cyclase